MNTALYNTYRPQSFDELVGQEHIVTILQQAQQEKVFAHAYLLVGPRGTGKTTTARIIAKSLSQSQIDIFELDAASNSGVDAIRDLIEKAQFAPMQGDAKVYIIDEVHMLSKSAFNALLKTLEEPPSHAYFVLATTEIHKVPITIISRTQRFDFHRIPQQIIVDRLKHIADSESITYEDGGLQLIARHAQGGLRDAITTLDQIRRAGSITEILVTKSLGLLSSILIEQFVLAYQQGDQNGVTTSIQDAYAKGAHMKHFLQSILDYIKHEVFATASDRSLTQEQFATLITLAESLMAVKFVFPGQEAFEMQMAVLRTMGDSKPVVAAVAPVVGTPPQPPSWEGGVELASTQGAAPKPAFRKREVEPAQAPIVAAAPKPAFSARSKYVASVETPEDPVKPVAKNPLLEKALSLFSDPS